MIRRFIAKWIYFIYEALRKIRRHLSNNALTVLTIGLSLFVFSIFFLIGNQISEYVSATKVRLNRIDVYLSPELSQKEIEFIRDNILKQREVKTVKLITSEQAKSYFEKQLGKDAELLQGIVIPPSFEVVLEKPVDEVFVNKLRTFTGVTDVYYEKEVVKHLFQLAYLIRVLGYIILFVLAAAVLLIISNTIRLSLYQFREEIELMQLVGATNWFIRWPFVLVGFIQGFFGALVAVIFTRLFFGYIMSIIREVFKYTEVVTVPPRLLIYMLLIGAGLGVLGSLASLGRFFKIVESKNED